MNNPSKTITPRVIVQILFFIILVPFLPLLIVRQWDWWEGWAYALISILGFAISRALAARQHPDLLAERARMMQHEDAETWDKQLVPLVGLGGVLIPVVAGLDVRFQWSSPVVLTAKIVALLLILAGYFLGSYALVVNRYFSGMVRIQSERNHQVVTNGPYGWVRHPGYAGAILTYLATPVFLEAAWAFVPVLLSTAVLIIRTHLEDKTLREKLAGYGAYAERVRYRLLPGVW
ncbi:MAG: isoprenylcysteine carboxylmethyltransferase family protein [Ardenticatenaceae bacterium]|nr:isoprenylcysteine carboxylmethyltransferase family protein [Ardenticatenaceae bacterium]